jgi:hypothetical protein
MTGRFGIQIQERRAPNARTQYYRDFVFGPRDLVAKGGFIEVLCICTAVSSQWNICL